MGAREAYELLQQYKAENAAGGGASNGNGGGSGSASSRRTSPLEDYYNEKRQKQAIEKANEIINSDILHGGTKPVGWQQKTAQPSGTSGASTSSRGRGLVGGLRDSYLDKHPNIPAISSKDLPSANQTVYDLQQRKKELEGEKTKNARYSLVDGVLTNNNTDYDAEIADIDKRIAETKKQDDYRTVWDKIVDTVTGAVTGSAASKSDAMRTLYESGQNSRTAEYEREIAQLQKDYDRAKRDYEETLELEGEDAAQWAKNTLDDVERKLNAYKKVVDENVQQKATQATADLADQLQQDSAERIERAKDGSGAVGRFAVDAGVAATQMGIDALTGRALGIGDVGSKASMALRAFGGGTQEARQGGGDLNQQLGYGGGVAAVELITEKLFDGLAGIYGKGTLDKVTEGVIGRLAKTDAGRTALRVLEGGIGEGSEELISDALNPILRTIYNGKTVGESYSEEQIADWGYDFLVGAVLGAGGKTVDIATGEDAKKNAKLRSGEGADSTPAAATTPTAQAEAPQASITQNPVADILARGRVNQQQAAAIMNSPEFTRMFEMLTGQKLSGTTNEMRTEIQRAAREYAHSQSEQQRQAEAEAAAAKQAESQRTQAEAERALSEYSRQEAQRDAEWAERRQQMENYDSYESYVRGLIRDGMTPAEAGEIARNPQMRAAWEQLTGKKLPTDSTSKARSMIMQTRENVPMPQGQRVGSVDKAIELMTGKKAAPEPQSAAEAQGDITTPPAPSSDAVTRPAELNSTINNNVETQNADTQKNTAPTGTERRPMSMEDYADSNSPVWNNLAYDDTASQQKAMKEAHDRMVTEGKVVEVPESTMQKTAESFPDLRGMKKAERTPILKQKMAEVKTSLRQFLSGLKGGNFEFEVNGNVLEAKLYDTGIKEVLEKITQDKANMLSQSDQIFKNAEYLYSLPDYEGNSEIYRWNYFYTPVKIGDSTVGVRIAVRDMKQTADGRSDSQIYNWGIKKAPTLDGGSPEQSSLSPDVSSVGGIDASLDGARRLPNGSIPGGVSSDASEVSTSNNSIPTAQQNVNSGQAENSGRPFEPAYNRNAAEPQHEKLSQFWENTLQKSEAAAGTPEEVSQPLSYLPKTEKQSLAEAASRLSTDRQGAIEKLINSEAWSGVQADTAWQVASNLYSEAAKTGNYEAYTSWRKVMDSHVIDTARGLQAQAKYTRHSGENALDSIAAAIADSKLTEAQQKALIDKVGKYATRFDNITRGMSDAPSAETTKTGKPSPELVSLIEEIARERKTWTFKDNVYSDLLNKQNDTYLKEYAYRQLIAMGKDSLSTVSTADKVKAAQSMAQLSSIASFARNIGGNVTFGTVDTLTQNGFGVALDKLISKATGKRTVAVDKGWFSSEARKGSVDAMQKSILEVAGDVDMGGENRYGQSSGRAYKMTGSPVERFMSRWQQLMGYSLTTSDKFSRGGIEAEQIRGLKALKDSGLTDAEIQQLASTMADYRLFQNQGMAYKASKTIHDAFNVLGFGGRIDNTKVKTRQGGFGLGDLVNTYPGVPANLGVKALEYSPANVLKGGVEMIKVWKAAKQGKVDVAKQQQAVMDISRGLAGVPAFALFAALTKAGFIHNWDDEDNKDVKAQNAAEGKSGIQVNLDGALRWLKGEENALEWRYGDTLDSIGWLEPINAFMAIGSLMAQEPEDVSAWSYIGDIAEGSIQAFLDIPVVSNLSDMIDTLQYSNAETWTGKAAEAGITYLGNMATGFIPSPVRGIAKASDEYYRDTSGSTPAEAALNSLKATIPGLRETLPKKLDNFGNEKMYSGSAFERYFNTLINPGDRTTIRQGDASAMLEKLREETGDAGIYPDRKAPKSVKYDDVESMLTPEQKREWQRTSGQLSEKLINDLKQVGTFDRLTPEQKAEVVKSLNQLAKDTAMKQFVESTDRDYKSDYDDERALTAPAEFYTAKKALSDTDGKKANFGAIDQVLKNFGHLKDDTQTALKASGLNVNPLLYAQTKGIKSKSWYDTKAAVDKAKGTLGGTDNAIAIAVYNSMKGKSDAEILDAIRAQVTPDSGGQQSAVVRRAEAYTTVAKGNADLGSWLNLVAALHNADENSKPNKDEVYAAWRSLGLRDNQTYAGITRDDFYNIVKSSNSYATKDDYATQIDEDYAKIDPAVEKERTTFPTTPVTEESSNSKSGKTSMDDYYRALGLIK